MNFTNHSNGKKKFLLAGDVILVFIALFLSAYIKVAFFHSFGFETILSKFNWKIFILLSLSPIVFFIFELYNQNYWRNNIKLVFFISCAVLIMSGIIIVYSYLFHHNSAIDRTVLLFHILFCVFLLFTWRKVFIHLLFKLKYLKKKILLIGNYSIVNDIESSMKNLNATPYDLTIVKNYSEDPGMVHIDGSVSSKSIFDRIDKKFDTIVVANRLEDFPMLRKQLFDIRYSGIAVYDAPYFYERLLGRVPIDIVKDSWFLFHKQGEKLNSFFYQKVKRIIDVALSLGGILLLSPLIIPIAIAIKLTSKGPVFFKQERLGRNERPFILLKFRTMVNNAEKLTGPKWAEKNDPRITKVGKFLRKTRLDELPQLFNILKGEMSLVGTRPIRKHFAEKFAKEIPHYRLRFIVKPGLTGWAQVQGGYYGTDEGQKEKLEYDLYYIRNQSVFFDLLIILKTISTVLTAKGE